MNVWCVMWQDTHCVIDGSCPTFLHSAHKTRRGADDEAKRQRRILRKYKMKSTTYTIQKRGLLP